MGWWLIMSDTRTFAPDWVSPPGDTVADLLRERSWSAREFAMQTGFAMTYVRELLCGDAAITRDAAARLAAVLGSTTDFWIAREGKYRAAVERVRVRSARTTDDVITPNGVRKLRAHELGDARE